MRTKYKTRLKMSQEEFSVNPIFFLFAKAKYKFMQRFIKLIVLMLIFGGLSGQELQRCLNTVQLHEQKMEEDEEYRERFIRWQKGVKKILDKRQGQKNPDCINGPIIIPLAIHFDSGLVPSSQELCAIDVVVDQINELNNEINGMDADAPLMNNFTSCFGAGILGDACIEFCIGQSGHPSGYGLVDGDYAITFGQVSFSVPGGNFTPVNSDWDEYINVYVDNLPGGLLGVSNGIPGNFNGDGVLVDNCVFGTGNVTCPGVNFTGSGNCFSTYDEGETLAHEIGHYLGLFHIWGDNFNCFGSQDFIDDTPDMDDNYSGYLSCGSHNSCSDLPQSCGDEDMYMNFMSYAGDGCMYMFSSDQSDVMNATAVLEGFGTTSPKCLASPVADFLPDMAYDLCNTDCIPFFDQSTNMPDSWNWSFQVLSGNITIDINSSTDQNPSVCVTSGTSGVLRVSLMAMNGAGSDAETKNINIAYAPVTSYYFDNDGDGFGDLNNSVIDCDQPSGTVLDNTDCDDNNANAYPGNTEICDGVDNDCDNMIDEGCMMNDCDGDFLVIDNISQNTYRAEINVNSTAVLDNGQSILFTAGTDIDLEGGFEVVTGTAFDALIETCLPVTFVWSLNDIQYAGQLEELDGFEQMLEHRYTAKAGKLSLLDFSSMERLAESEHFDSFSSFVAKKITRPGEYLLIAYYGNYSVVRRISMLPE